MIRNLSLLLLLVIGVYSQYTVINQDIGSTYVKQGLKYTGQSDFYVKPKSKMIKELVFHFQFNHHYLHSSKWSTFGSRLQQ